MEGELVVPLVHLNGTSADALCDGLDDVFMCLEDAATALRQACPNRRDYYPLPDAAWYSAQTQHTRRLKTIRDLQDELAEEIRRIREQKR